MRVPEMDKMLF